MRINFYIFLIELHEIWHVNVIVLSEIWIGSDEIEMLISQDITSVFNLIIFIFEGGDYASLMCHLL